MDSVLGVLAMVGSLLVLRVARRIERWARQTRAAGGGASVGALTRPVGAVRGAMNTAGKGVA
jgi:hypothetical protein